MMRVRLFFATLIFRVSLVCALLSCFGFFSSMQVSPVHAQGMAFVRIIHASPDIGTADVFVEGSTLLTNFEFGTVTNYVQVPPGTHKVQVALIGKGVGASIISQNLTVDAGVVYTVAALGTQASGFSLEGFLDNNDIAAGKAKVRVYQLSPDTGSVNVATGNNTLVSGLTYKQASDYVTVPQGSYSLQVSAPQNNTTLPASLSLKANTVTSVFTVGRSNGSPSIRLVNAQVKGVPGMPGTGSDPNPLPGPQPSPTPWLIAVFALFVLAACAGMLVRRTHAARQ